MRDKGQTLLEIIIGVAILTIIMIIATSSIANLFSGRAKVLQDADLVERAREGIEISYNLSARDWENFKLKSGDYYPRIDTTIPGQPRYILATGEEDLGNGAKRKITITKAKRDASGNIDDTGETDDETMRVVSTVKNDNGKAELVIYVVDLTNIEVL